MRTPYLRSKRPNGAWLHYYRRGGKETPIPGTRGLAPDDPAVIAAWSVMHRDYGRTDTPATGTLAHAVAAYQESAEWAALADGTRKARAAILRGYLATDAARPLASIDRDAVEAALMTRTPSARRNHMKALRGLFAWLAARRMVPRDPTRGVDLGRAPASRGFPTASSEQVAAYLARWPVETVQGLAFRLAMHTGAARVDLVRLGPGNVRGGVLSYERAKTSVIAHVPVTVELAGLIAPNGPVVALTYLHRRGRPYSPAGLGNIVGAAARAAGLPPRTAIHAARKAFCVMWAERGRSASEIAAMAGHMSLREVERYTREADRRRMVAAMMEDG